MLTFEVTYSERDYLRAIKFLSRRQSLIINGFVAFGVLVVSVMIYRADYNQLGWWVKPFFGVLFIVFLILLRMVQLRNPGKIRKDEKFAQSPFHWMLSNESIKLTGPLFDNELKWEAIIKVLETKQDFFFYMSKRFALILPKRFVLAEPQMIELRHLISEKLGDKAVLIS